MRWRAPRWHRRTALVGALVVALGIVGSLVAFVRLRDDTGPLLLLPGGQVSIRAPRPAPEEWTGTFGSVLCLPPGVEARIKSVDYDVDVRPLSIRTRVRTAVNRPGQEPIQAIAGMKGTSESLPGQLDDVGADTSFEADCDPPGTHFAELLTELRTGRRGGSVVGITITYVVDGWTFTREGDLHIAVCGAHIHNLGCRSRRQ